MSLIGQFGVGLYSVYLIANKVVVTTKDNVNLLSLGTEHQGHLYRLFRSSLQCIIVKRLLASLAIIWVQDDGPVLEMASLFSHAVDSWLFDYGIRTTAETQQSAANYNSTCTQIVDAQ
jgi:hypothetical protein